MLGRDKEGLVATGYEHRYCSQGRNSSKYWMIAGCMVTPMHIFVVHWYVGTIGEI